MLVPKLRRGMSTKRSGDQLPIGALQRSIAFDHEVSDPIAERRVRERSQTQGPRLSVGDTAHEPDRHSNIQLAQPREDISAPTVALTLEVDTPLARLQ